MDKNVPIDGFDKINFVTSVLLLGCVPPFSALFKFAKEPTGDLIMYMITPDLQDLVKEWLRPGRPRYRKPARHGKKRLGVDVLTDPWGTVNSNAAAKHGGGYPGLKLPGAKALFKMTDMVDRVNNSAFILESVTEIGFRSMLGAIDFNNDDCAGVGYVHREFRDWGIGGGAGGRDNPLQYNVLLGANRFQQTGPGAFRYLFGPWRLSGSAQVTPQTSAGLKNFSLQVKDALTLEVYGQSGNVTLEQGENAYLSVSGEIPMGRSAFIGVDYDSGFFAYGDGEALAWGDPLW